MKDGHQLLLASVTAWLTCLVLSFTFLWIDLDGEVFGDFYLLPWCFLAGVVVLSPVFYYFYKGSFDPFHPLIFGSLFYIFPALVLGGVILSFGWSDPFYLAFIEDQKKNLPLSLIYVALGYIGLIIGFASPISRKAARLLDEKLPKIDWKPSETLLGGIGLIIAGFGVNILSFLRGLLGYQKAENVEIFDGLLIFLQVLLTEGVFLLWLAFFSEKNKTAVYYLIAAFLIVVIPIRTVLIGSRSALMLSLLPIAAAYFYAGKKVKIIQIVVLGVVLSIAAFLGAIYGTSFRNIKGSEARIEAGDYIGQAAATIEYLSKQDLDLVLEDGARALAERIENLSSLAVVVSNYEKLAPYEAAYGLENNIFNDLLYSFVPRFLYPEKPNTSDARAYSDLYFNYGENSFTITPFGDLLRNFGPLGIPLGMILVGAYFRLIYSTLIETKYPAMWKKVAYYPLLTVVSYESFYATIFPSIIRTLLVVVISLWFVNLSGKLFQRKR
ncbi:MAG: hypothetical protein N2Z23_09520 [Pyrinomonadaceae bacterium]|nr:hypothetical protein [Pyrinomonadaceae bacterium]